MGADGGSGRQGAMCETGAAVVTCADGGTGPRGTTG